MALSAAGVQFLSEIAPDLQTIENAIEHIGEHSSRPSGRLRLNIAPGVARMLLEPLLLEYGRRYPEVELEVVSEKGLDAGVRLPERFRPIWWPFRSPDPVPWLSDRLNISRGVPSQSSRSIWCSIAVSRCAWRTAECIAGSSSAGVKRTCSSCRQSDADATGLILAAAHSGAALAYIGEYSLAAHMAAGRLNPVVEEWCPAYPGLSLFFATPPHARQIARLHRPDQGTSCLTNRVKLRQIMGSMRRPN